MDDYLHKIVANKEYLSQYVKDLEGDILFDKLMIIKNATFIFISALGLYISFDAITRTRTMVIRMVYIAVLVVAALSTKYNIVDLINNFRGLDDDQERLLDVVDELEKEDPENEMIESITKKLHLK